MYARSYLMLSFWMSSRECTNVTGGVCSVYATSKCTGLLSTSVPGSGTNTMPSMTPISLGECIHLISFIWLRHDVYIIWHDSSLNGTYYVNFFLPMHVHIKWHMDFRCIYTCLWICLFQLICDCSVTGLAAACDEALQEIWERNAAGCG